MVLDLGSREWQRARVVRSLANAGQSKLWLVVQQLKHFAATCTRTSSKVDFLWISTAYTVSSKAATAITCSVAPPPSPQKKRMQWRERWRLEAGYLRTTPRDWLGGAAARAALQGAL